MVPSPGRLPANFSRIVCLAATLQSIISNPVRAAVEITIEQDPFSYNYLHPFNTQSAKIIKIDPVTTRPAFKKNPSFDRRLGDLKKVEINYAIKYGWYFEVTFPGPWSGDPAYANLLIANIDLRQWRTTGGAGPLVVGYAGMRAFSNGTSGAGTFVYNRASNFASITNFSPASPHTATSFPDNDSFTLALGTQTSVNPFNASITGEFKVDFFGGVKRTYEPKTWSRYVIDELTTMRDKVRSTGAEMSDQEIVATVIAGIVELRESSAATSSLNLDLRDAEYFLRGFRGGLLRHKLGPKEFLELTLSGDPDGLSPVGTPFYLALKAAKNVVGGVPIGGSGSLPATPIGGLQDNWAGYLCGTLTPSVDSLIENLERMLPLPVNLQIPPTNREAPLVPAESVIAPLGKSETKLNTFYASVETPGSFSYFDPAQAQCYAWSVSGNRFTKVLIPADLIATFSEMKIAFEGREVALDTTSGGDIVFDFTALEPVGVAVFALSGVSNGISIDHPVFGFQFAGVGETLVVNAESSLPIFGNDDGEPDALAVGFAGGDFTVAFADLDPRKTYEVRRGTNGVNFPHLVETFTPLMSFQSVEDPEPPSGKAFYRLYEVE